MKVLILKDTPPIPQQPSPRGSSRVMSEADLVIMLDGRVLKWRYGPTDEIEVRVR